MCRRKSSRLPLARDRASRYSGSMLKLRRFAHLLLALALVIGPATHAAQPAGLDSKASMAAAAMPMCDQEHCDMGGTEPCDSAEACSTPCNSTVALAATRAVADVPPTAAVSCSGTRVGPGWSAPPDPYPPRLNILS